MLKALYDYGIRHNLSAEPGFQRKQIRAYICLTKNGVFLGIEQCGNEEMQACPDIGSLANGPDKCNPLAEKLSVILGESGKKTEFFRTILREGKTVAPVLGICLGALEDADCFQNIRQEAILRKLKDVDRISFKIDGNPIVIDDQVREWWKEYRKQFSDDSKAQLYPCLITGKMTVPLLTLPTVNGLQSVGGHSRGEALFCFDKSAFQSYGLKKTTNAPVSEEAFAVVKEAMNDLLKGAPAMYHRDKNRSFNPSAPIYAGMKFLHWFDFSLAPEEDPLLQEFQGEYNESLTPEELQEEYCQIESEKKERADTVIKAIATGKSPVLLNGEYHIILISGNNGRAMIRRYEHGNYQILQKNLQKWRADLTLRDNLGLDPIRPKKFFARLVRLVKDQKNVGQKLSDQIKKELAGITPAIISAIVNDMPLPDTVAVRALAYIRSKLLSSDDSDKKSILPDGIACQWLKVWLIRKQRMKNEEVTLMECYDNKFPNAAYHCGAWLAVYANLQRAAMGDVNATLVQRFYSSASRTPALVFGTLERMGEVYLDKLRKDGKGGLSYIYENRLNMVCSFFGQEASHQLPTILNLEGQSYFALGYRQMCTQIIADIKAKQAEKEEEE